MKSYRTTLASMGALITLAGTTLNQLFDGNTATNPDWNLVLPVFFAGLTGLFSRDNKVSSEEAGAK